jgi:hypothetical protein
MAASGALCARLACDKNGPIPGEPGAAWRVCCPAFVLVATGTALAVSTSPGRAVPSLGRSLFWLVMLGLDRARVTMRGCSWLVDEFGRSAGIGAGGGRWPRSRCRVVPLS